MNKLKEHIIATCFTKVGSPSSARIKLLMETSIWNLIVNRTQFIISDRPIERIYCIVHDLTELPTCLECDNKINHFISYTLGYSKRCSRACSNKSESTKNKYKETMITKYGVDNSFKATECIDKIRKIKLEQRKSGIDPSNKDKHRYTEFKNNFNTLKVECEALGFTPLFDNSHYIQFLDRKYKCLKCSKEFYPETWQKQLSYVRCLECKPKFKSNGEGELRSFLSDLKIDFKIEDRTILKPKELDIVIESHKIAIEYNGLLWHSYGKHNTSYLNNFNEEDSRYHLNKTNQCIDVGYQLLHITQNEWENVNKQKIWKSIIKSKLGLNTTIGARTLSCIVTSKEQSTQFLNDNHLQGNCNSSVEFGLYHQIHGLLALLTISKSRFNKNYDWEITRYCNKVGYNVVGGFSKLLSYFRKYHTGSIITYADKRYSTGDMYKKSGFTELKDSPPNYFYFTLQEMILHSRVKFQKHKLKDILKNYDQNKTESENMFNNGYRRIWDCGNKVFILT